MRPVRRSTLHRALILGGVTGLRAALGPALVSASRRSRNRELMALASLGEMVVDKLPLVPSRSSLPLLIPRALAGYWVGRQVSEQDRVPDPNLPLLSATAAVGAALLAPTIRSALGTAFRVPDPVLGAIEDALAVSLGSRAARLSPEELQDLMVDSIASLRQSLPSTDTPALRR
ncbi:hypothetical protein [Tautonia marina]|uniref:hypothetical protein n=1 Tax=Tautonia marina TaxID=2653855 RepID=UPI001260AD88|nr:hypothetical protein [Tautonia marina]